MKTNELAFLKANHVKPVAWRITAIYRKPPLIGIGHYVLEFTHQTGSEFREVLIGNKWVSPWNQVHTRRGEPKEYKTVDAVVKDINHVQGDLEAVIYLRYD